MNVFPDFNGLGGIGDLRQVIGALLMFVLITSVLIVSAIVWAVAATNGNYATAGKARTGVLVAVWHRRAGRWRGRVDELAHRPWPATLTPTP